MAESIWSWVLREAVGPHDWQRFQLVLQKQSSLLFHTHQQNFTERTMGKWTLLVQHFLFRDKETCKDAGTGIRIILFPSEQKQTSRMRFTEVIRILKFCHCLKCHISMLIFVRAVIWCKHWWSFMVCRFTAGWTDPAVWRNYEGKHQYEDCVWLLCLWTNIVIVHFAVRLGCLISLFKQKDKTWDRNFSTRESANTYNIWGIYNQKKKCQI